MFIEYQCSRLQLFDKNCIVYIVSLNIYATLTFIKLIRIYDYCCLTFVLKPWPNIGYWTMFADTLLIVAISICTALFAEGLWSLLSSVFNFTCDKSYLCWRFSGVTYILVYRTEKYKKLKSSIEKQTKKCMCTNFQYFLTISVLLTVLAIIKFQWTRKRKL